MLRNPQESNPEWHASQQGASVPPRAMPKTPERSLAQAASINDMYLAEWTILRVTTHPDNNFCISSVKTGQPG